MKDQSVILGPRPGSRATTMSTNKDLKIDENSTVSTTEPFVSSIPDSYRTGKYYPRGFVLFREGQMPPGVYVLCEGRAKISISSVEGKTLLLRIAHPGELLGLNATLSGQPYSATAITLERCRIDFISRYHLLSLLERDTRNYQGVVKSLTHTVNGLVEQTRLLFLSQTATERLARLLLKWCEEQGEETSKGIMIRPGLTHEEIGQIIGASRETVTRILNSFKRKQLVTISNGDLVVLKRASLLQI